MGTPVKVGTAVNVGTPVCPIIGDFFPVHVSFTVIVGWIGKILIYSDLLFQSVKTLGLTFPSLRSLFQCLSTFQIGEPITYLSKKKRNIESDNMPRRYFVQPPRCCGVNLRKCSYVKSNSPKGNANRPFYKCFTCKKMMWNDYRGIRGSNPPCNCGGSRPSRLQVEGEDDCFYLVFRCQDKRCFFAKDYDDRYYSQDEIFAKVQDREL